MAKSVENCTNLKNKYKIFTHHADFVDIRNFIEIPTNSEIREPIINWKKVQDHPLPPPYDDEVLWYDGYMSTKREDYKSNFKKIPNISTFI